MPKFGISFHVAQLEPVEVSTEIEAMVIAKGEPTKKLLDAGWHIFETRVHELYGFENEQDIEAPRRVVKDNPQA